MYTIQLSCIRESQDGSFPTPGRSFPIAPAGCSALRALQGKMPGTNQGACLVFAWDGNGNAAKAMCDPESACWF